MNEVINKQNIYCVYIHIFPNGKKYIGITSRKPEHRWGSQGKGYYRQTLIWNAICKYGWNNIQHIIICTNKTDVEAQNIEKYLIQTLNARHPYGYNLDIGGKGSSENMRQRTKEHHANFMGGNHPKAKAVYCIELNKIYLCMRDAQRELGINVKDISRCCKRLRNTAGNYHWIYADEIEKCNIDEILQRRKHAQITNKKKVRCVETNKVFDSITQASEKTGIDLSSISACCRGKLQSINKLHWEFIDEAYKFAH